MQDYQKMYQEKLTTPENAVKIVKSGDWLDYSHGISAPNTLDKALADRAEELEDINIRGFLIFRDLKIYEANDRVGKNVFTFNSWHFGGVERRQVSKGYAFFAPMRYTNLPFIYSREEDVERVDVLMMQVAPMDKYGYFNIGPSNSATMATVNRAKHIILEVNENIPHVNGIYGENIHISKVDYLVESNEPIDILANAKPSDIDQKIATYVLDMIPNGATLQLGIGGMPNAVGEMIAHSDLKDLGIHTEMYVDSMMEMTKAGVITGTKKNLNVGKQVFTFGAGSKELYDFMDNNPDLVTAPVDYVNNPVIIAQHDNFISINNAIEIDLTGQVSAESTGFKQISGTGGQLDFVLGAYKSKGGKSIIALSSTFKGKDGKTASRIVPFLQPGTAITDPRSTTEYVATEYGVYNIMGKSMWQRAEGLINLAHPDFREQLIKEAENHGIWRRSNK